MAAVSKEEYLKRYLSDGKRDKKKRKKTRGRMKIIDDAEGLDCLPVLKVRKGPEDDEDGPEVALLDKTTAEELALMGKFKRDAFKTVGGDAPKSGNGQRRRHDSSGSDPSPPRRKRQDSDSDASPPRRRAESPDMDDLPRKPSSSQPDEDSDLDDLPRAARADSDEDSDLEVARKPAEDGLRASKTLSGQTAGLQSASALRKEAEKLRKRDEKSFRKADPGALGKDAGTVFRDRGSGKRRDLGREKEDAQAKAKREEEMAAKYKLWNKGVRQVKDRAEKIQEIAKEAEKPFARYEGDADLESHLKEIEMKEDPMLEYMQKKKARTKTVAHLPKYSGRPPPPNRFGIWPGYRWDGVDRGNGFENKIYHKQNEKVAQAEEFYRWQSGNYE